MVGLGKRSLFQNPDRLEVILGELTESRRRTYLGLLQSLERVLGAEQARGYDNRAVIGGLDRFLEVLLAETGELVRALKISPPFRYAEQGKAERQRWVAEVLQQAELLKSRLEAEGLPRGPGGSAKGEGPSPEAPITQLKGVSSRLARKFERLGVRTIRELLYFFPRRHVDYSLRRRISELELDLEQTVLVRVWETSVRKSLRGRQIIEAIVGDETGNMRAVWFNQPYLARKLTPNTPVLLSGKVTLWGGQKALISPEYEFPGPEPIHAGRLVPVYSLTEGLSPRTVRRVVKEALDSALPGLKDFLPEKVRSKLGLLELPEAISQAHYPESEASKAEARRRLAFDELFLIQLGLALRRQEQEGEEGISLDIDPKYLEGFLSLLPFELTGAQRRVLEEIRQDLAGPRPMNRLLQGEVGSGKTVVATAAMLLVAANGYQSALMAPTEILAQQHFANLCSLLGGKPQGMICSLSSPLSRPLSLGLLTGGLKEKEKEELRQLVAEGKVNLLIGTHALIQKEVVFHNLGLVVVDEQHRFGVRQRLALRQKGPQPHMLVMSATPIPRTLALTIYGDLDLSVLDELPPGRREVKTRWLGPRQRQQAYDFIRQQVAQGHQAFIICPLIEESEAIQSAAAVSEYERLSKKVFPDLRLGLLHGRLSSAEKDEVMQKFRSGELDILVSTPVVEVGIDVPNATVILIEGAERFGLAQLHQFRGRVWRSSFQAYCLLLSENPSEDGKTRLSIMEKTHDGFLLAEEDLKLRGPGEFFGTRQSGLPDLKMARLSDLDLLEKARKEAWRIVEEDHGLKNHPELAREVKRLWRASVELN